MYSYSRQLNSPGTERTRHNLTVFSRLLRFALVALVLLGLLGGCKKAKRQGSHVPAVDYPGLPAPYQDIGPRFSPDGRHIAFLRRTPDRRQQLCIVDTELKSVLPLLGPEMACPDRLFQPSQQRYLSPDALAWSPDSKRITFPRVEWFRFEDGDTLPGTGLWTLHLATGRVVPLAIHPQDYKLAYYYYRYPQWSPDGRYVAFVGEEMTGERRIFVRVLKGQKADEVAPRFDDYEDSDWPAWQPKSSDAPTTITNRKSKIENRALPTLAYRRKIQREPGSPRTETLRRLQPGSVEGSHTGEIWRLRAVDYARLLDGRSDGPRNDPDYNLRLVQYPTPGTPLLEAVAPRTGHLTYSPDGKQIAFTLTPTPTDYPRYELWTLEPETGKATCVRAKHGHGYLAPVWIGNNRLGALSPNGDRYDVVVIELLTGKTRILGTIGSADCDWSPDRRSLVYATQTADKRGETTLRLLRTGL